jgi:4-hydroxyphenylpyruvate dioxygenase
LTNNVFRGAMDRWYHFYQNLFNFRQIRYFNIAGKITGLYSRALTSPCGKIRIPLNESADDKSQIEEFLHQYKGEGIQHIACGCKDIYATVKRLAARGLAFMPAPPDSYYKRIAARLPGHGEPLEALRAGGLLIDGEIVEGGKPKLLLQIFSKTVIGPIFSSSSNARATRDLAREISRRSSSRSKPIKSNAACSGPKNGASGAILWPRGIRHKQR